MLKNAFVICICAIVALYMIGKVAGPPEANKKAQVAAEQKRQADCAPWRDTVQMHIDNGLFTNHSNDWKEVQIDPTMWNRITADNKKIIIDNTAKCMSDGKISFKDRMSGKVLGDRGYFSTATLY